MKSRFIVCFCAMFALSGMPGCGGGEKGPELVKVKGKVNYNAKPVSGATVTLIYDQKGPLCNGFTNADGEFTLTTGGRPGAMVGEAKVSVTKSSTVNRPADPKPEDLAKMAVEGGYKPQDTPKPEIPVKYSNPTSSGLTANVVADASKNTFEFNLVD